MKSERRRTGIRVDAVVAGIAAMLVAGCLVKPKPIPGELEPGWVRSSRVMSVADLSRAKTKPDVNAIVAALAPEKLTAAVFFGVTKPEADAIAAGLGLSGVVFEPETGRERGVATMSVDKLVDVKFRTVRRGHAPRVLTMARYACYCITAFRLDSRDDGGRPFDSLLAETFVYSGEAPRPNCMAFTWDYAKGSPEAAAFAKQFKMMTDECTFGHACGGFGIGWWHASQYDVTNVRNVALQPGAEAVVMRFEY